MSTKPALLLCLSLLLWILTACGGQEESAAPAPTEPPAPTPAETPAKTESGPGKPNSTEAAVEAEPTEPDSSASTSGEVTEPATVRQLAQLLDLSKLELPEGTETPGQSTIGQLMYQTPPRL
ncbi:MAG: hypothetical protein HC875_30245 [Anaerolineales bacterium]|nr:hypothetical protein [Anaerolineales bacterium]